MKATTVFYKELEKFNNNVEYYTLCNVSELKENANKMVKILNDLYGKFTIVEYFYSLEDIEYIQALNTLLETVTEYNNIIDKWLKIYPPKKKLIIEIY